MIKRLLILLLPLTGVMYIVAKSNPEIAENIFANHIYDSISQPISRFFGLVPISVAELLFYAFILFTFGFICRFLFGIIRTDQKGKWIRKNLFSLIAAFSLASFLYMLLMGTNYYRYDFLYYTQLELQDSSSDELAGLCGHLAEMTNQAKLEISEGTWDITAVSARASESMSLLGSIYPVVDRYYPKPKPMFFSKGMSYARITGIFTALTMEANINIDQPFFNIPADMCHELTHLAGFMREDEANYIAYLACVKSGYPEFVYSGMMSAFIHSSNALYREDQELWQQVMEKLDPEVIDDLNANTVYWKRFNETRLGEKIGKTSEKINDTYLKLNGQSDGVKSYGRMVDLLLAEYRAGF